MCPHCFLDTQLYNPNVLDDFKEEDFLLSVNNISKAFSEDIEVIKIFGGEFLLLSYGKRVIKILREFFKKARIIAYTNGKVFLDDKNLFHEIIPDRFHISVDQWHKNVNSKGESNVANAFVEHFKENRFDLTFHWCKHYNYNDNLLYGKFKNNYQDEKGSIEFQYSRVNTLSGRSRLLKNKKKLNIDQENDKYVECTLGKDLFLNYNNELFNCSWGSKNSYLCIGDDPLLREKFENYDVETIKKKLIKKTKEFNSTTDSENIMCIQCQNITC